MTNLMNLRVLFKNHSLMHLNILSLQYQLDENLVVLLFFSLTDITKNRLNKDIAPLKNINLQNYSINRV